MAKGHTRYSVMTSWGEIITDEFGEGTPLIFFHGWSVSAPSAFHFARHFAPSYRVILPTLPGAYPSCKIPTDNVSLESFESIVQEWFLHLRLTNAIIVGHSLGGAFAALTAAHNQDRVRKLLLLDSVGVPLTRQFSEWSKLWIAKRVDLYRHFGLKAISRIDRRFFINVLTRSKDTRRLSTLARTVDLRPLIQHIHIPTHIIWGDSDMFIPKEVGMTLAEKSPEAVFHLVKGNHDWPLFEPEKVRYCVKM